MQNNKHYYLINGTVKVSDSKMPVGEDYVSIKPTFFNKTWFESDTKEWLSSLQPCEIDESELEKIKNKVYTFDNCKADNPIDITDIVEEKDGKIYFKQPTEKQVESECEAVDDQHGAFARMYKKAQNMDIFDFITMFSEKYKIFKNR